jgi:hypothetical protein
MLVGVFVNTADISDVRRGIAQFREWEAALSGVDAQLEALRDVLGLDSGRLVRLAHTHFGTGRFTLPELAVQTGEGIRILHGMTGSLARACESRNVQVFDRFGGQPLVLAVRQEVAGFLTAEAGNPAMA